MFAPNLFTNAHALAGKTRIDEQEAFYMPGMPEAMMAFRIDSEYMYPTFTKGDIVLCRSIEHPDDVQDGELYAILAYGTAYVRRIKRSIDNVGNLTHIELWTEDGQISAAFRLPIEAIQKVLKVTNVMSEF